MNELEKYLNTKVYQISDSFVGEQKDEVLKYLLLKGVAYSSEIARDTNLNIDTVNRIIQELMKHKFIKKYHLDPFFVEPIFYPQIFSFWARGVYGFEGFVQYSFWIISLAGFEYMKSKYKGKEVMITSALIKHYGLLLDEKEFVSLGSLPSPHTATLEEEANELELELKGGIQNGNTT